jgi:hypothetical protein
LTRGDDALRFLHAKRAWHEVDLAALVLHPATNPLFHVALAGLAIVTVLAARWLIPRSWSWFTVLYLVPSFALGVIGMARYATETFPPVIASGVLLERHPRHTTVVTLGILAATQAICAYVYIGQHILI